VHCCERAVVVAFECVAYDVGVFFGDMSVDMTQFERIEEPTEASQGYSSIIDNFKSSSAKP